MWNAIIDLNNNILKMWLMYYYSSSFIDQYNNKKPDCMTLASLSVPVKRAIHNTQSSVCHTVASIIEPDTHTNIPEQQFCSTVPNSRVGTLYWCSVLWSQEHQKTTSPLKLTTAQLPRIHILQILIKETYKSYHGELTRVARRTKTKDVVKKDTLCLKSTVHTCVTDMPRLSLSHIIPYRTSVFYLEMDQ